MLTARPITPSHLGYSKLRSVSLVALSSAMMSTTLSVAQSGPVQLPATPATKSFPTPTAERSRHQSQVSYVNGSLTVVAENSSLNEILRDIARQTGLKVTGRVSEDRVFGTYGPEAPLTVLTTLLDGSGVNVLLVQNASHTPTELILTPRSGTASPPNPNAQIAEDDESTPPPSTPPAAVPRPQSPQATFNSRRSGTGGMDTNPAATSPSSTTQQIAFPPIDATTPSATATITPTSPDTSTTVKTPQQIFEQLQKLRQQQTEQPQN